MSTAIDFGEDDIPPSQRQPSQPQDQANMPSLGGALSAAMMSGLGQQIAGNMWSAGSEQAKQAYGAYARVDLLRPYFDVEVHQVRARLLRSFLPTRPSRDVDPVPTELYGPLMLVFSLVTVLLFGMKHSGTEVREGTLMGTALAICFGYWIGGSSIYFFFAYIFNTSLSFLQILYTTGYGLVAYCVCLLVATMLPGSNAFLLAWAVLGSLSAAKMALVFFSRTADRKQGLIVGSVVFVIHWVYLFYLFRAYHMIVGPW
ncbi:natural killer cell-specific antigen KLIP1 [Capsaspora owczarzaki ATCC 30864]|uniref:Protein YIPF3 n=1 Tax=Capsaspora owczarzaki (strain ATCC 30864) TaxID=595528 RepID=A0A0D2VGN1_CAPO3|nr:natural killer cell-specific antigen KLIP1 [Capsaspora owczarzaki ATCC 30864]KJE89032.1 natural killer cell-specific antigen KLIP1 [Capsaspora owczarzaki ATCC 30864]|eukprot:XP_004365462.1 natural killer cell-specific antigen KLIP1 [Capsaspora owczarzaki ATCC 30864]